VGFGGALKKAPGAMRSLLPLLHLTQAQHILSSMSNPPLLSGKMWSIVLPYCPQY
jgi:hypothetical protein